MKFRTEYQPDKSSFTLSPENPVVLVGSCFSQNIARKMALHDWMAITPFGTLYNPLSISLAIESVIDGRRKEIFENSLFNHDGVWHSDLFDSSFSSLRREDCIAEFENRCDEFMGCLQKGKVLIVTFGTSICYFRECSSLPVGNCHKLPSKLFYRRRLSVTEIVERWKEMIEKLQSLFPAVKVVFTVSPVRHIKDGLEGNSRSKAVLQLAVEEICHHHNNCHYFPAFEILNDDLRDYRFYAADLCHPSEEAIEYVWEKFIATYCDEVGVRRLEEGVRKVKSSLHRPMTGALGKPLSRE